jgi:hypothetical protein
MVTDEGWYRVTKRDIVAAGFDPGTDARRMSLYTGGIEQPLLVIDNDGDGNDDVFDDDDALEFYGFGNDTPWSGARAYWLVRDKGENQRVKSDKSKQRGNVTSTPTRSAASSARCSSPRSRTTAIARISSAQSFRRRAPRKN